jgi:hypothetical protein
MQTKGRFKDASFSQAVDLISKTPRQKTMTMALGKMFRGKKKLWDEGEYENTNSIHATGVRKKRPPKKVTLPIVQFTQRKMDGET